MLESNPQRGRPKDPAKRAAILEAAKCLFLREGYAGTSMEAVAAAAGVSKPTVYSHFADKGTLFSVAVQVESEALLPLSAFTLEGADSLERVLRDIGKAFIGLINSPEAVGLHRLMTAQVGQDNDMARLFFEAGPQPVLDEMERLLARAHQQGLLRVADAALAAEQFFGLLQGCHHMQVLIGYREPLSEEEVERRVSESTALFLRALRPGLSTGPEAG